VLQKDGKMLDTNGNITLNKKVILKPYIPREIIKRNLANDNEIINNKKNDIILDVEIYPNYFLIACKIIKIQKYFIFELNFNEQKLSWIMHNYRTIGFNSLSYDLPIIWAAIVRQDIEYLKQISDAIIYQNTWRQVLEKEFGFKIFQTSHIDLINVCPLKGSLKLYGARLHAKRIQDLPIDINSNLDDHSVDIVCDYCYNDLDTTELLFVNLAEQIKLREELSIQYKTDCMSKSDAQIAESVIGTELKQLTGKWPKKPNIQSSNIHKYNVPTNLYFQTPYMQNMLQTIAKAEFGLDGNGRLIAPKEITNLKINIGNSIYRLGIGGLHSSETNMAVKADDEYILIDKDVASYYPRIVLNLGLYPQHLGKDFLTVYKTLVERRLQAKKAKNIAIAECLKITINGTFGKTGSPYSFLYAPEMTIQITVGGQLYLLMLIELLELANIFVVSANTDGIVIKCHRSKLEQMNTITKQWESITGFETEETEYEALYSRDVNSYMAIKKDKTAKGKSDYYDPWRGKSARDGYWRFQKNCNRQICVEAIEKLICNNIPIEQTIKECTDITKFISIKNVAGGAHFYNNYLGKVVRWAYFKNERGTINYISNNHIVPDTLGAKPLMDLPIDFPTDLDYDWYIKKTISMLEDMAYLTKSKQMVFF
jgi:hypothetical protein